MSYLNTQDQRLRATILTNFLLAELLGSYGSATTPVYLISPWITNFPLQVPNRSAVAGWIDTTEAQPSLFDSVRRIAESRRTVRVVVRTETAPERVAQFWTPLQQQWGGLANLVIRHQPDLHAKLYVGEFGALYGSLNLTRSGMERNVEFARYVSDARTMAQLRNEAEAIYVTASEGG